MVEARTRRTQVERSANTRTLLLDATIQTLCDHGYAAATTMLVAEQAGVSRGAMQHQFRTKADLMTFVVKRVYEEELVQYATRSKDMFNSRERLSRFPEIVWDVLSRPSGIAVLEILQGSRSDPDLQEKLAPIQRKIEDDALTHMTQRSGLTEDSALAMMRLIVWSARGLSIAQILASDPSRIRDAMELLGKLIASGFETGVLKYEDAQSATD